MMKVKLEKDYRKYYTLDDLDRANAIISELRQDESSVKEYAKYAAREALRDRGMLYMDVDIVMAQAYTSKNCRAWNNYDTDSEDMDVWVEFLARSWDLYIEGGAYLTDIWKTGCESYDNHMYIRYFKECK